VAEWAPQARQRRDRNLDRACEPLAPAGANPEAVAVFAYVTDHERTGQIASRPSVSDTRNRQALTSTPWLLAADSAAALR